jgi:glyoxylase-like metal-dependent hydrolase (beta-lactamase superfamily II)
VAPLRDRIELVDPDTEVANGVRLLAAPGQTPGMLAVEVGAGAERLLHVADAAFPVLSLARPDWFALPDGWPARALQTRRALFA